MTASTVSAELFVLAAFCAKGPDLIRILANVLGTVVCTKEHQRHPPAAPFFSLANVVTYLYDTRRVPRWSNSQSTHSTSKEWNRLLKKWRRVKREKKTGGGWTNDSHVGILEDHLALVPSMGLALLFVWNFIPLFFIFIFYLDRKSVV